jgi:colanic acid biosynthesis glycosyl transferase WcaI
VKRGGVVLAVSNPPTLPVLAAVLARVKRCTLITLVHDVYPDALARVGAIREGGPLYRMTKWMLGRSYRASRATVALGQDMKDLLVRRFALDPSKVKVIPNWADCDEVTPADRRGNSLLRSLGIESRFVVQWAGNMGRTHDLECLVEAARMLRTHDSVHFLFAGWGAKRQWLEETVGRQNLRNVSLLPNQPRDRLPTLLNACDLSAITFIRGMAGVSVPSRLYNALAAAKPVLAAADEASDLSRVLREENVGWVVPPGDSPGIVRIILEAETQPALLEDMGRRARALVERDYAFERVLERYALLLCGQASGEIR